MIKAILIDDEPHILEELQNMISDHFGQDIVIVATANSVENGLKVVNEFKPNLLYLDINLSDGTGFDLISKTEYKGYNIIFITAFDNQAIRAIRAGALDYIVKPLDLHEFKEASYKAIASYKKDQSYKEHIEVTQDYFNNVSKKRIILKTSETIYAVYEEDILYLESDGNYTTLYTLNSEKIIVSKYLKNIVELLSEEEFIRCHRSYVINKQHILKYHKKGFFILQGNLEVPVARALKQYALKKAFS